MKMARIKALAETATDYRDFNSKLKAAGYSLLGEGHFGKAWGFPGSLNVVKVSRMSAQEDGYGAWVRWLHTNQYAKGGDVRAKCPAVPRVFLFVERETFTVTVLERLENLEGNDAEAAAVHSVKRASLDLEPFTPLPSGFAGAVSAVRDIAAQGWTVDIHGGNVMKRANGQLVLTDPLSFPVAH